MWWLSFKFFEQNVIHICTIRAACPTISSYLVLSSVEVGVVSSSQKCLSAIKNLRPENGFTWHRQSWLCERCGRNALAWYKTVYVAQPNVILRCLSCRIIVSSVRSQRRQGQHYHLAVALRGRRSISPFVHRTWNWLKVSGQLQASVALLQR
jgi:hypothetical protein